MSDKNQPLTWLTAIEKMTKQKSYKSILLLSIISEIENGNIRENKILFTKSLVTQFNAFYEHIGNQQARNKVHLPFYYLQSDVWDIIWENSASKKPPSSIIGLTKKIKYAVLNPHLFSVLTNKNMRDLIKERLFLKAEEDIRYKDPQQNETFTPPKNISSVLEQIFGEVQIRKEPALDSSQFNPITLDFAQEKLLQEFLVHNWDRIPYFQKQSLQIFGGSYQGIEYDTKNAGRIDILAEDIFTKELTVIELKRGKSGERHLGQLLRYMGWVRTKLAQGKNVFGLLIASSFQDSIRFALREINSISLMTYQVDVQFNPLKF